MVPVSSEQEAVAGKFWLPAVAAGPMLGLRPPDVLEEGWSGGCREVRLLSSEARPGLKAQVRSLSQTGPCQPSVLLADCQGGNGHMYPFPTSPWKGVQEGTEEAAHPAPVL